MTKHDNNNEIGGPLSAVGMTEKLLDIAGVMIVVLDTKGDIALLNRKAEEILDYTKEILIGKNWFDTCLQKDIQKIVKDYFFDIISGKQEMPESMENYIVSRDGKQHLIHWKNNILKDESGTIIGILSSGEDITKKHKAEEELKANLKIQRSLAEISKLIITDRTPDINHILKIIGEVINVNRVYIFKLRDNFKKMDNTHEWCAPRTEPQIDNLQDMDNVQFPWWMLKLKKGENIVIEDVNSLPVKASAEKELLESQKIRSLLVVPFQSKAGTLTGFMGFDDTNDVREWSEEDIQALKVICEMLQMFWEGEETKIALDFEREQLLSIFESISEIVYVSDPQTYEILFVNDKLKNSFNKELIGKICYKELQGLDSPCDFCTNEIILKDKSKEYQWEYHNPTLNRYYMITDRIIRWPDGRDVRFEIAIDISERKKAERLLQESEEKFRNFFETSRDIIYFASVEGKFIDINPSAEYLLGYTRDELFNLDIVDLFDDQKLRKVLIKKIETQGFVNDFEMTLKRKDSTLVECLNTATLKKNKEGKIIGYQGIIRDISDKKMLETQLMMSQKMEAVGTLAGGIAHDFNNILATIMGFSSYLLNKITESHPFYEGLAVIEDSSRRASELTTQLLAFSRRGKVEVKTINLNRIVKDTHNIISKTFDRSIKIRLRTENGLKHIEGDESQLSQIVMNLVINARDAMPDGGILTIRTFSKEFSTSKQKKGFSITQGDYSCLSVSDNGIGIEKYLLIKVFEPYYTTKRDLGSTGLGLSVVFGIVKEHNGFVDITSEVGKGTEVLVYLPTTKGGENLFIDKAMNVLGGSETILVVDDEKDFLSMAKHILKDAGYVVLTASSGNSAIKTYKDKWETIDLVVLDIVMPGISGREVMKKLMAINPDVKVLLASGYSEEEQHNEMLKDGAKSFIGKPFSGKKFLGKVRETLN
jgi:PAS domain S-box-containing protein